MTTLGVITDIHGNLVALDAVLTALDDTGVDRIVCCGDILGMLGWPEETATRIRTTADVTVYGNHDAVLRNDHNIRVDSQGGPDEARLFEQQLSATTVEWINSLPATVTTEEYFVTHAYPDGWGHCHCGHGRGSVGIHKRQFREVRERIDATFVLLGHTHQQCVVKSSTLTDNKPTVINPGSVGVPWDDGNAEYAVVDLEANECQLQTVGYESTAVQDRFIDLGIE